MTWAIFSDAHTRGIVEMISTGAGADRITAVVGGALLDDTVRRTLSERLRNDTRVVDDLLEVDRPLGNLGPKIDLLYLLHGIDEPMRTALKGISKVRNFFAHTLEASFVSDNKKFLKAMDRLKLHDGKTHYPHHLIGGDGPHLIEPVTDNRSRFIVNLKLGLIALMRDRVSHVDYSNQALTEAEMGAAQGSIGETKS